MSIRPVLTEEQYKDLEANNKLIQAQVPNRDVRFDFARKWRSDWPVVIAEGDSWFDYPLTNRDIVHHLSGMTYGCAVKWLAHHGDTLEEMLTRAEWLPFLNDGNVTCLLLSGGGNDILGDPLEDILTDGNGAATVDDVIDNVILTNQLTKVSDDYTRVINATQAINPNLPILAHGYDYVIPSGDPSELFGQIPVAGPWLKDEMDMKDIPDALRQGVIERLIDGFSDTLAALDAGNSPFTHVDVRGTLDADEWADAALSTTSPYTPNSLWPEWTVSWLVDSCLSGLLRRTLYVVFGHEKTPVPEEPE